MDQTKYIVLKFGGTSQLKSTYELITDILNNSDDNTKFIIILSAQSEITNELLKYVTNNTDDQLKIIINKNLNLANDCNVNIEDYITEFKNKCIYAINDPISIVASGEFFTCNILNNFLLKNKIKSELISSLKVISSDIENIDFNNKGNFTVNDLIIKNKLIDNKVIVIPGFSGVTPSGKCCLLGRGGSDTSGSIVAAALNAIKYEIWTDVCGIYSADPRKIKNTKIIKSINYNIAQEIAAMGAKVIHPYSILPCAKKNIPIIIKNTFNPYQESTLIQNDFENEFNNIYGITVQDNVKVFKITSFNMWNNYGFVYDIFSIFKEYNIDINIINTSQFNITTTTDENEIEKLHLIKHKLKEKYNVEIIFDTSIVSIVANNIKLITNIGDIFKISNKYNIITTSYSSNDMSLSFVLPKKESIELIEQLHEALF